MKKTVIQLLALLLLAIASWKFGNRSNGQQTGSKEGEGSLVALSSREAVVGLGLHGAGPSRSEIIERFPETPPGFGMPYMTQAQKDQLDLYRPLGVMDGEAALDYLFETIPNKRSSVFAMTAALTGWMETDMEAALAAFQNLNKRRDAGSRVPPDALSPQGGLFEWKGERFYSGLF